MKVKLARFVVEDPVKSVDYKEFTKLLEEKEIMFLEPDTDAGVFKKLQEDYECVKIFTSKYGLNDGDFVYEVHLIG